ncbi:MAG: bifunctional DNA primase/polymerase [Dehalococcoidia bacterium]
MLDAALEAAEAGWNVFPCVEAGEHGKAPYTAHGHLDASRDADQIREWWGRWPNALIGAAVPDSLLVIDIDPRNNGRREALEALVGPLPETLMVISGRGDGGAHFYYLRPPGNFTSTRLPEGVDLKTAGYCIIPPSLHPTSGRPYVWEHHDIAPLPTRLRELLRPLPPPFRRPVDGSGNASGLVHVVEAAREGQRNNALHWAACRASEEGSLSSIEGELIAAALRVGLSDREARRTVQSAVRTVGGAR